MHFQGTSWVLRDREPLVFLACDRAIMVVKPAFPLVFSVSASEQNRIPNGQVGRGVRMPRGSWQMSVRPYLPPTPRMLALITRGVCVGGGLVETACHTELFRDRVLPQVSAHKCLWNLSTEGQGSPTNSLLLRLWSQAEIPLAPVVTECVMGKCRGGHACSVTPGAVMQGRALRSVGRSGGLELRFFISD